MFAQREAREAALELIAKEWDGCTYDAACGGVDIGATIRASAPRMLAALSAPAEQARQTGYVAPVGKYVLPVLFSPYTGDPRDARDIATDPQGILIVPPGAAMLARAAQPATPVAPIDNRDAVAEALRRALNGLPRYSFHRDDQGNVCQASDRYGKWIEWQAAHELFDSVVVDGLMGTPPVAPKTLEALTGTQVSDGLRAAIDLPTIYESAAFKKGVRFAERHHGIATKNGMTLGGGE